MDIDNKEKIKLLFEKLYRIHKVYIKADLIHQEQILEKSGFLIIQLEQLGVSRELSVNLIMGGMDFVKEAFPEAYAYLKKNEEDIALAEQIFETPALEYSKKDKERSAKFRPAMEVLAEKGLIVPKT